MENETKAVGVASFPLTFRPKKCDCSVFTFAFCRLFFLRSRRRGASFVCKGEIRRALIRTILGDSLYFEFRVSEHFPRSFGKWGTGLVMTTLDNQVYMI